MKGIDTELASISAAANTHHHPIDPSELERIHLHNKILDMFHLPPMEKKDVLDEVFHFAPSLDYCDNEGQKEVLRHHYRSEFVHPVKQEILKDYCEDSIIHKVVDEQPSTYRGKNAAINAWHDLNSYIRGPCKFDLQHISVCRNHAQVNWKAEVTEPKHLTMYGTDSFTFDDTNHITMQTTVALSEKEK